MTALFLVVVLFACLLLGVPIAVSLGLASVSTLLIFSSQSPLSLVQKFFHTMQVYPLLAVPFFVLAGTFMTSGGVARRMIEFANAVVGHLRGGLAMASVLACYAFRRGIRVFTGNGRRYRLRRYRGNGWPGIFALLCRGGHMQCGNPGHTDPTLDRHGRLRRGN